MTDKKKEGQYMTPDGIVSMILNNIGYTENHVLTRKIMEPSFGDGAFLINIVQRIISEGTRTGLSKQQITDIIQANVFGIEKDKILYQKTLERLNSLLAVYDIPEIQWEKNLTCGDTLIECKKHIGKYDYVVGNMDNTHIIFPYEKILSPRFFNRDGVEITSGYKPLTEDKLKKSFPKAYAYLSSLRDELTTRDMDKNADWFLFGRSQGIQNSCFKKVVFKHVIDKGLPRIVPHILDEDVIVYSGMYTTIDIDIVISPKTKPDGNKEVDKYIFDEMLYEYALKDVYKIFQSPDFAKYCSMVGKDMAGGYVGISTKMVKQFGTQLSAFPNFPIT